MKNLSRSSVAVAMLIALALIAAPISAATWNMTDVGNDETMYFFDADTVLKSGAITTVWVKTVQKTTPDSDGAWATATQWQIHCTNRTIKALAASDYDKNNKFIRSYRTEAAPSPVFPDSTGEGFLNIACKANFPRDKSNEDYTPVFDNDIFAATRRAHDSKVDSAPN